MNKKMAVAYKKCMQQIVEVQEEVIADRNIQMNDRISFISFTNKIKQTLANKVISDNTVVTKKEVITNEQ